MCLEKQSTFSFPLSTPTTTYPKTVSANCSAPANYDILYVAFDPNNIVYLLTNSLSEYRTNIETNGYFDEGSVTFYANFVSAG